MNPDLALLLLAAVVVADLLLRVWHWLPGRKSVLV